MSARMTNAVAAKKALFDLLRAQAVPGGGGALAALATTYGWTQVDVKYGWVGGDVGPGCIYGGGWRFDQDDEVAEGPGLLMMEVLILTFYCRTQTRPASDVEVTDLQAVALADVAAGVMAANPLMAGALTYLGVVGGFGDYSSNGNETVSVQQYQVRYRSHLTWRG